MNTKDTWYMVQGNTYIQNGLLTAFQELKSDSGEKIEGRIRLLHL